MSNLYQLPAGRAGDDLFDLGAFFGTENARRNLVDRLSG